MSSNRLSEHPTPGESSPGVPIYMLGVIGFNTINLFANQQKAQGLQWLIAAVLFILGGWGPVAPASGWNLRCAKRLASITL